MDLRIVRIESSIQVLAQKQAFLHKNALAFAPGGPAKVVRVVRPHHVRQEDGHGRSHNQALRRFQPVRYVVSRSPLVQWGLKLLTEVAKRNAAPAEKALALAFRPPNQFNVEHTHSPPR